MSVVDQSGADRSEQAAMFPGSPVAPDHNHLGFLGQVDERWHRPSEKQFAGELWMIAALRDFLGDFDRVCNDVAGLVLLNLEYFLRNPPGRPHER
jgi:hypothetical protein